MGILSLAGLAIQAILQALLRRAVDAVWERIMSAKTTTVPSTSAPPPERYLSTVEAAIRLQVSRASVMRLFERRLMPEPERVGHVRLIPEGWLPEMERVLREHGWLK